MTDLAIDDEDGGQVDEAEVMAGLLLRARQHTPEAVEPAMRHLHHPTPWRVTIRVSGWRQRGRRARLGRDVRRCSREPLPPSRQLGDSHSPDPRPGGAAPAGAGSITMASSKSASFFMSWRLAPLRSSATGIPLRLGQADGVWCRVCPDRWGCGPWLAPRQRPLFAERGLDDAPVGGLPGPVQANLPVVRAQQRRPGAAPARHCAIHSVKRTWTVDLGPNSRGSCDHWAPVRASQISPSKMARSSRRGRPGFLRGLSTRRTGRQQRPQRIIDPPDRRIVFSAAATAVAASGRFISAGYHLQDFLDSVLVSVGQFPGSRLPPNAPTPCHPSAHGTLT